MVDYAEASLWDLSYYLDQTDPDSCANIDPHLADKLQDMDNLMEIYYYLACGDMHTLLPNTKIKVNELLTNELETSEDVQWWQFKNFVNWLSDDLKQSLAKEWMDNDSADLGDVWMANSLFSDTDTNLRVLKKLVRMYKKKKNSETIGIIERIFSEMGADRVEEACEVIVKATPAVIVSLLRRNDIPEKYTLKGLKALSKLSKQRELDIKIDFDTLKNLGPKARLDAMKQLFGMFDKYYQFKKTTAPSNYYGYSYRWKEEKLKRNAKEYKLPFTEIPKREDIEKFLFPCSLKYNDEVVSMIERFNELISHKEEDDGKCI